LPEQVLEASPVVEPNTPAGQREHVVASVTTSLVAPDRAYDPISQVTVPEQEALVKPVVAPNVPPGQAVHIDEPSTEYVPAAHRSVHVGVVSPAVEP
jgi:hypothetical protein